MPWYETEALLFFRGGLGSKPFPMKGQAYTPEDHEGMVRHAAQAAYPHAAEIQILATREIDAPT